MTKTELIEAVAKKAGVSKTDAGTVFDAVLDTITKTVKKDDKVTIVGFGSFSLTKRKARSGRNPQTGATIKIKATKAPKFTAGKAFKDAVK